MPKYIAEITVKTLKDTGKVIEGSKALIMGLTYKEDVADTRETPSKGIIKELRKYGVEIWGYDPLLDNIEAEFGIRAVRKLSGSPKVDVVVITVGNSSFKDVTLDQLKGILTAEPILIDIRGVFSSKEAEARGFIYRSL